jgi:hypothetical protein
MRKASSVFYLITGIASCVGCVLLLVLAILGLAGAFKEVPEGIDPAAATGYFVFLLIFGLIEGFAAFVGFHGHKLNKTHSDKKGFHIFCIVLGAIADAFLLLAGIFGLIGSEQK